MGKFDKYKIDLKGMQTDSAKYEFVLDNLYFAYIDGPEVQKGKVNILITYKLPVNIHFFNRYYEDYCC